MSRYVVTGGAGFIGSSLVRTLLSEGAGEVAVIDNLLSGKRANLDGLAGEVKLHAIDIRSYEAVAPVVRGRDCRRRRARAPERRPPKHACSGRTPPIRIGWAPSVPARSLSSELHVGQGFSYGPAAPTATRGN